MANQILNYSLTTCGPRFRYCSYTYLSFYAIVLTQDEDGFLMESDIPGFAASDEAILAHGSSGTSVPTATLPGQNASFKTLDYNYKFPWGRTKYSTCCQLEFGLRLP